MEPSGLRLGWTTKQDLSSKVGKEQKSGKGWGSICGRAEAEGEGGLRKSFLMIDPSAKFGNFQANSYCIVKNDS